MKMRNIITLGLLLVSMMPYGCKEKQEVKEEITTEIISEEVQSDKISLISPEALDELIKTNSDIQILDVRTAEEVAEGKIAGSVNISVYEDEFAEMVKVLDTTKPVYIYCEMGGRSADAAKIVENIFPQIYDLEGGITSWEEKKLSITKEN
jgi:rhodanese-related sulfurtransferase